MKQKSNLISYQDIRQLSAFLTFLSSPEFGGKNSETLSVSFSISSEDNNSYYKQTKNDMQNCYSGILKDIMNPVVRKLSCIFENQTHNSNSCSMRTDF